MLYSVQLSFTKEQTSLQVSFVAFGHFCRIVLVKSNIQS